MALINGVNMLISADGNNYGCTTNQTLNFVADMIDATCKDTGTFKDFISGEKTGTVSVDALYNVDATEGVVQVFDDWKNGTEVAVKFGEINTSGGGYFYFNAIVQDATINGPKNEVASYSFTLQIVDEPGYTTIT